MLPLSSRSTEHACDSRLMLFDDVLDVMAGIQAFCVGWTGLDHILRRGATRGTWDVFNQILTSRL